MAPILSKPQVDQTPKTAQEAVVLAQRLLNPLLDGLLRLVKTTLVKGGEAAEEVNAYVSRFGLLADQCVQRSVRLLESYCCLDLKRYARGPEPKLLGSMPLLFVLMLLLMLYNAFVFGYMPGAGIAVDSPVSMLFHALIFLVLASLAQAMRTDPGGLPTGEQWRTKGTPPPEARERKRGSNEARWCRKSQAYKPDRAHYCRVLDRVVLRMDHHCPWLGNTVGHGNHKFFILFLFYASSACSILGVSIVQLLVHATLPALTTFVLVGAEGLALLLSSILVPFFVFHFWLLARNMTTIEFCEMVRGKDCEQGDAEEEPGSRYDIGFLDNIRSVMGANPLTWCLPIGGPMGDGVRFPQRGDADAAAAAACPEKSAEALHADQEAKEADPEAVHPAAADAEDTEGASIAGEDGKSSSSRGLESGRPSSGLSCAEDFLVWHSAAEFTDDLRIGCEFIGEALEGATLRLARLYAERCCTRPSVVGVGPRSVRRRSSRLTAVRFGPLRGSAGSSETDSSARSPRSPRASDFLSS